MNMLKLSVKLNGIEEKSSCIQNLNVNNQEPIQIEIKKIRKANSPVFIEAFLPRLNTSESDIHDMQWPPIIILSSLPKHLLLNGAHASSS